MTEAEYWENRKAENRLSVGMIKPDQCFTLSKGEKVNCLGQFSHTHKSYHDLILALLLSVLLKVERLVVDLKIGFDMKSGFDTYYLDQLLQRAAHMERPFDIQPPFEALTVFIHSHDLFNHRTTSFIASLLKLPAIREISGGFKSARDDDLGNFGDGEKSLMELNSSSSPLTSLDLADYGLSTAALGHVLRAPKALKTLVYWFCPPTSIKFSDIRHALGPQENCLESLAFHYSDDDFYLISEFEPMRSFISFKALKVFKIEARFLATTDNGTGRDSLINIFPPSLETLHLIRFNASYESLLEALEHLLAQKSPQQVPSLKKLMLEEITFFFASYHVRFISKLMDVLWKDTEETAIGRLGRVAAAHGVSVDVLVESSDY